MAATDLEQRVAVVRRFNRFYTKQIGLLDERFLHSPFSLTAARVLYELAQRDETTATELRRELGLDAGYLSRILRGFVQHRLIDRKPATRDARQSLVRLTAAGRRAFARLDAASSADVGVLLERLPGAEQYRLVAAMAAIAALLGAGPERRVPYVLRPHRPGDMGWVVQRHGELYAQEYGWDEQFEALVAEIVAKFIKQYDPKRERCWIAERDGQNVGSVFLVRESDTVAAAVAPGRAASAGAGHRPPSGGRMHRVRPSGRLWQNDAVDQQRARRGPAHLRAGRISARARRAAPQFRTRPDRTDVGPRAVTGFKDHFSERAAARSGP